MTSESESVPKEKSKELLVSVIIPVYQVSAYVERCLLSVMNQTFQNIECIIVDDCSMDDSIAKCERLIEAYEGPIKFHILHHERNRGLSAARNTGTDAATGEYVFYLDGDDELTIDCIDKLIRPIMIDSTIEIVMGNYQRLAVGCKIGSTERLTLSLKEEDFNSRELVRNVYFENGLWQAAWNKLIRRDLLQNNGLSFKEGLIWEDTLWIFYVVKHLRHLYTIPDITYHYIKHPMALTNGLVSKKELARHWCNVYDEIVTHLTQREKGREAKYHIRGLCYRCIDETDNQIFRQVANKYLKVLYDEKYLLDWCLFYMMISISRYSCTKMVFHHVANKLRPMYRKLK